jgi:hypothetical protein
MRNATYELNFGGGLLERGFWLYVWEITTLQHRNVYYVGRTGDSSSNNAQSPFNRMGQHLGFNDKSNVLRRRLKAKGIDPEECVFRMVAHGPILEESITEAEYRQRRDRIAAMEAALAARMHDVGYDVMNTVKSRIELDEKTFAIVLAAFTSRFPALNQEVSGENCEIGKA